MTFWVMANQYFEEREGETPTPVHSYGRLAVTESLIVLKRHNRGFKPLRIHASDDPNRRHDITPDELQKMLIDLDAPFTPPAAGGT